MNTNIQGQAPARPKLLTADTPILILPSLASAFGIVEAAFLQQLHYLIQQQYGITHQGQRWIYNTLAQWQAQLPCWSVATLERAITHLKKLGIIHIAKLGNRKSDRTNYYQTVPKEALDTILWLESDRMGYLLGAVDQKRLDEQRGVVQNEKRQGENEPYGRVLEQIQLASFPEGHPYRWETIGSMEDLNAASLDDVKTWFRTHYGAANATLVLAGDIDLATAKEKTAKFFGDIDAGPPQTRRESWIAPRSEPTRDVMYDRVAQVRIHRTWNVPGFATADPTDPRLAGKALRPRLRPSGDTLLDDGIEGIERIALTLPDGTWHVTLWTEDQGEWEYLPHPLRRRRIPTTRSSS